eukprot:4862585-Pleurochrysis_carterae.AAC.1
MRRHLVQQHYSKKTCAFSRSFVVGDKNDCCAAAAGFAAGISFATFANTRAGLTGARPEHSSQTVRRDRLESEASRQIEMYILDLRDSMEGTKGALDGVGMQWHTIKRSSRLR